MNKDNRITTSSSPGLKTQGTSCRLSLKIYCSKWNGDFFKKLTNTFDYIKIRRGSGAIEDEQDVHVICFKDSWLAINKISDFVDVLDS